CLQRPLGGIAPRADVDGSEATDSRCPPGPGWPSLRADCGRRRRAAPNRTALEIGPRHVSLHRALSSTVSVQSDNDPSRVTRDETMMVVFLFGDEGGNMRLRVIFAVLGLCVAGTVSAPAVEVAPLELVADVPLSGAAVRFDYQSLDVANNRL